nr:FAD:protein FMN transferase [uncultured Acetatifactor sp.]
MMYMLIMGISGCSWKPNQNMAEYSESFFAMDTYMTFTAYGMDAEAAVLVAEDKIGELEALWSVTDKNSDIYAVNHSAGRAVKVNQKTAELISFALDMAEKTNGVLELTIYPVLTAWGFTTGENRIPTEIELAELLDKVGYEKVKLNENQIQTEPGSTIDMGAVGKGYAGDEVAQVLRECGITAALLDIGVENGIASVSVIASEGKLCDALSTALFVMGLEQAKEYWRQRQDYEMILIMEDGNIYLTEGMRDRFSLNSNYKDMNINVID